MAMYSEASMRPRPSRRPALGAAICIAALLSSACFGGGQQAAQPTAAATAETAQATPPVPPRPSPSPSPSPSPAAVPAGGTTYTVDTGDTLATISEKVYGDPTLWRQIYEANREAIGDNPDNIKIGTELRIPPKE
jgi:nucleoid-associated protein YgaU